jgi:hypothetical protein
MKIGPAFKFSLAILLYLLSIQPGIAQVVYDNVVSEAYAVGAPLGGNIMEAQIFTAHHTGTLFLLSVRLQTSGNATIQLRNVVSGVPGPTILASITVPITVPCCNFTTVQFPGVIQMIDGTQYAIVVTDDSSGNWIGSFGVYPPQVPAIQSTDGGLTWQIVSGSAVLNFVDQVLVTPKYSCAGFQAPFDIPLAMKAKTQRAIPLKIQLKDASGNIINDGNIGAASPVVNITYSGVTGPATDETSLLEPLGQADSGNMFIYDPNSQIWQYDLSSSPFTASGTYTVTVNSGDETKYSVSPTCSGTFVRK